MKKLAIVLFLFSSSLIVSQSKSIEVKDSINLDTDTKITSLIYSVDSAEELEKINWDDVKSIFETNKPNEIIKMTFRINEKESNDKKVKVSGKFSVEGKTEDIDGLINLCKKGIKGIIRISEKDKNN